MEVISPDLSAQVCWKEQGIFTSYQGNLVTDMDAQQGFTENLLPSALALRTLAAFVARPSSAAGGASIFSKLDSKADVRRG